MTDSEQETEDEIREILKLDAEDRRILRDLAQAGEYATIIYDDEGNKTIIKFF